MKVYQNGNQYFMDDNEVVSEVFDKRHDGWLWLPENSTGRKFVSLTKLAKKGGEVDYGTGFKEARHITVGERAPRKSREEWLDGDDLTEYRRLNALIDERIAESKRKPMTELEKAERAYKKALEKYQALAGITEA